MRQIAPYFDTVEIRFWEALSRWLCSNFSKDLRAVKILYLTYSTHLRFALMIKPRSLCELTFFWLKSTVIKSSIIGVDTTERKRTIFVVIVAGGSYAKRDTVGGATWIRLWCLEPGVFVLYKQLPVPKEFWCHTESRIRASPGVTTLHARKCW